MSIPSDLLSSCVRLYMRHTLIIAEHGSPVFITSHISALLWIQWLAESNEGKSESRNTFIQISAICLN